MSLFRRERIGLGVAAAQLACSNGLGATVTRPFEFEPGVARPESLTQGLRTSLRALLDDGAVRASPKKQTDIRVVVASDIARHWIVEPPTGVSSLGELRLVAAARFSQIFGSPADAWSITGDWRVAGMLLCAALPRWLTDGLESACRDAGVQHDVSTTLGSILHVHRECFADDGWNCVRTPRTLAVLRLEGGLPVSMRLSLRDSGGYLPAALADGTAELRREALRRGEDLTAPVIWLDLASPVPIGREALDTTVETIVYRVRHLCGGSTPSDATSANEALVAAALGFEGGGLRP